MAERKKLLLWVARFLGVVGLFSLVYFAQDEEPVQRSVIAKPHPTEGALPVK